MKKFTIIFLCLALGKLIAQRDEGPKWMLGIHGGFNQYNGEMGNGWYATDQAAYSFGGISLTRILNRHFDVSLFGTRGDIGYKLPWDETNFGARKGFLMRITTLNLQGRYYFIGREPIIQPFVFAGAGLLLQSPRSDNFYPGRSGTDWGVPQAGLGFNLRLTRFMLLQFQETFMYTSADYADYREGGVRDMYLMHSAGLLFNIPKFQRDHNGPDLVVDKCPPLAKELQAKKDTKKRARDKKRADKKRRN